jgi:hypothetical protein
MVDFLLEYFSVYHNIYSATIAETSNAYEILVRKPSADQRLHSREEESGR